MNKPLFISAIDTDAGKSIFTGLLAKYLMDQGQKVITHKMAQTGCQGISEDIQTHRKLCGIDLLPEDYQGATCPYVFKYPASPHLAAALEKQEIDPSVILQSIEQLQTSYETVLVEGAGGLLVPVKPGYTTIDFIQEHQFPLALVSSARLGSINHTLLSLEACLHRNIEVKYLVYNHYPKAPEHISIDTLEVFKEYLHQHFPQCRVIHMPLDRAPLRFDG
ncbi:dethiobiotin synthase [Rapidithrix thailandica]|uniref:ATP-dependent dethiobiotin synthetase BioD n=1 Tax=Rapidithrix thailandica TaxID=413964 RepID=A0AAW9SGV6_9BACT